MRRKDREITDLNEIIDVMRKCDVCRLALNDEDGFPYVIPLNFGLDCEGENIKLYFHSALEGKKLDLIRRDSRAAFEMDCSHELKYFPEKAMCTMNFMSVCGRGTVELLDADRKADVMARVMAQYHPDGNAKYNPAVLEKTAVYCLTVTEITGKRKG